MATQRQLTGRERRIDDRFVVNKPATIRAYRMETLKAEIVDISTGGAMLTAENSHLFIGDEVVMTTGTVEALSTVAWIRAEFFGLSFHRRLVEWQMKAIRKQDA